MRFPKKIRLIPQFYRQTNSDRSSRSNLQEIDKIQIYPKLNKYLQETGKLKHKRKYKILSKNKEASKTPKFRARSHSRKNKLISRVKRVSHDIG